jgi:LuxR family transcriptional activator of bioluminescence operon
VEAQLQSIRTVIKDATRPGHAIADFLEIVRPLGCTSIDCVVSERVFLSWGQSPARHVFFHAGFPGDWGQRWPRYAMVDPLLPATALSLWPVEIEALACWSSGSALQRELLQYLQSSGLAHGVSVPVHLPGGAFSGVGFYQSAAAASDPAVRDQLFMMGQIFCRALAEKFSLVAALDRDSSNDLTEREIECLYWASVGKTTEDIAEIIGRATQTVRFHLDSATRKLGAVNRVSAVAQACARGLITPR